MCNERLETLKTLETLSRSGPDCDINDHDDDIVTLENKNSVSQDSNVVTDANNDAS